MLLNECRKLHFFKVLCRAWLCWSMHNLLSSMPRARCIMNTAVLGYVTHGHKHNRRGRTTDVIKCKDIFGCKLFAHLVCRCGGAAAAAPKLLSNQFKLRYDAIRNIQLFFASYFIEFRVVSDHCDFQKTGQYFMRRRNFSFFACDNDDYRKRRTWQRRHVNRNLLHDGHFCHLL